MTHLHIADAELAPEGAKQFAIAAVENFLTDTGANLADLLAESLADPPGPLYKKADQIARAALSRGCGSPVESAFLEVVE